MGAGLQWQYAGVRNGGRGSSHHAHTHTHTQYCAHKHTQEFARRGAAVCGKDAAQVSRLYTVAPDAAPFFCLDLSFCHTVLAQGFDLEPGSVLTLVKRIAYKGRLVEASWPLGLALDTLAGSE